MFAVRPRKPPLEPKVGELESRCNAAPVTFSIGCLDIRHRLPDPKSREIVHLSARICYTGVSTPQGGACPPRSKNTYIRPIFLWVRFIEPKNSGHAGKQRRSHGRVIAIMLLPYGIFMTFVSISRFL